ncbi:MAG: bifunctional riboflavin kinase/FAD synthetase [Candidatus Glassbacteria bacterium]
MSRGNAITVGTFDGVHLGHRKVLDRLISIAREKSLKSVLVTFDPHPVKVVNPDMAPKLLTTTREKLDALSDFDLDRVEVIDFDLEFSKMSAEGFIRDFLYDEMEMKEYIIGYNHGFGRGREGSVELARRLSKELGFGFTVIEPFLIEGGKVSSSLIRKAVSLGNVGWASRALGRFYSFSGKITEGQGRGRGLGYPTVNLVIDAPEKLIPSWGIYAVLVGNKGEEAGGMMHIGPRPTFQEDWETIEIHIFDFEGKVTCDTLTVRVIDRIRDIITFGTAEELRKQLMNDEKKGRKLIESCKQEVH